MKTKETNNERKTRDANFPFSCGDFQKMAEMMKNCCPDEGVAVDCCSMMRRMMERGKRGESGETAETQNPPEGGGNG